MANVFIESSTMTAIGDAIRAKTGGTDLILPANMATEIGNITTGGGGSGGGGGLSFLVDKAVSTMIYSVSETPIVEIKVPTDATNISYWQKVLTVNVFNSSYTIIKENYVTIPSRMIPYSDMTVSDAGNGYKLLKIPLQVSFAAYSGAYFYQIKEKTTSVSLLAYTMPALTIEDNVLYASAECNALMYQQNYLGARLWSYYLEGIDLRGSNITHLAVSAISSVTELKKLWLPEKLTYFDEQALSNLTSLQELHFTSTTPPSVYNNEVWKNLPTTCKIYVPSGTLSAYTSASKYPSSSTYTYIEE